MDIVARVTMRALMRSVVMMRPLTNAAQGADGQAGRHRDGSAVRGRQHEGRDDAGEGQDRAHRDVEAAGQHDERLAGGHDAHQRRAHSRLPMLAGVRNNGEARVRMTPIATSAVRTPRCSGGRMRDSLERRRATPRLRPVRAHAIDSRRFRGRLRHHGQGQDLLLGGRRSNELAGHPPVAHDDDPVGQAEHLDQLGRDEDDRHALAGESAR